MLFGVLCLPGDQSHPFAQPTINPLACCICWAGLLGRAVCPPWNEGLNFGSYSALGEMVREFNSGVEEKNQSYKQKALERKLEIVWFNTLLLEVKIFLVLSSLRYLFKVEGLIQGNWVDDRPKIRLQVFWVLALFFFFKDNAVLMELLVVTFFVV